MNLRDYHDARNGLLLRIADVRRELQALEASLELLEDAQAFAERQEQFIAEQQGEPA